MRLINEIIVNEDKEMFMLRCMFSPEEWCKRVHGMQIKYYHKQWLKAAQDNRRVAIEAFTGCLAGDSLIKCNRSGNCRTYKIKDMYAKFNNIKCKGTKGWNRSVSSFVRSFDGKLLKLHKIRGVSYSGKKQVFLLSLSNGNNIKATADHKIMTQRGWVSLNKLVIDSDKIMVDTIQAHKKTGSIRHKYRDIAINGLKFHPHGGKYNRIEIHRAIYESSLNKLELFKFIEIVSSKKEEAKLLKYIDTGLHCIHHSDGNHYNNSITNLECITKEEHIKRHAEFMYLNFSQGIPLFSEIVSIDPKGIEDTYDIQCEDPHHNFVANGIVVHNSGKTQILGICYPLWLCWYRPGTEVLIVSKSMPQATKVMSRIKDEIETNELLRELIPSNKPESAWSSKTDIALSNRSKIYCRPYSHNIKSYHVNYILADEVASYPDSKIFFSYVTTRTNQKNGTLVAISTPETATDLMVQLSQNDQYHFIRTKVMDEHGCSNWPEAFPIEKINNIRKELGESTFKREYLCSHEVESEKPLYPYKVIMNCCNDEKVFESLDYADKSVDDTLENELKKAHGARVVEIFLSQKEREIKMMYHRSPSKKELLNMATLALGSAVVYYIGADFAVASGPKADYDAYTVVKHANSRCEIVYAERMRGASPQLKSQRLEEISRRFPPRMVYLDQSGIGVGMIEELRNKGIPVTGVSFDHKNRKNLLVNLRRSMDGALRIPKGRSDMNTFSYINTLIGELLGFTEVKTKLDTITYHSTTTHDDTVMSLALAVHGMYQFKEPILW